jgi:hypothetical protein
MIAVYDWANTCRLADTHAFFMVALSHFHQIAKQGGGDSHHFHKRQYENKKERKAFIYTRRIAHDNEYSIHNLIMQIAEMPRKRRNDMSANHDTGSPK